MPSLYAARIEAISGVPVRETLKIGERLPSPATGRLRFYELAAQKTNFGDLCQARWECREGNHVSAMAFGDRDRARRDRLYDPVGRMVARFLQRGAPARLPAAA